MIRRYLMASSDEHLPEKYGSRVEKRKITPLKARQVAKHPIRSVPGALFARNHFLVTFAARPQATLMARARCVSFAGMLSTKLLPRTNNA